MAKAEDPPSARTPPHVAGRRVSLSRALVGTAAAAAILVLLRPDALWPALAAAAVLLAVLFSGRTRRNALPGDDEAGRPATLWPDAGTKAVVEALPEPALVVDRALHLRYRNAVSESAFGPMALGDLVSLRLRQPDFVAALESAVENGAARAAVLVEGRRDERVFTVDILPVRLPAGGPPPLFVLLFRDSTAERRIERMRTDFVANASHELRTPLASLIGFIETLQGPAREDAAARGRFLDIMRDQAARMSRLIDDLLSLSRIEMKPPIAPEARVDLAEIFEEVRRAMEPVAEEAGVAIETAVPRGAQLVNGDRDELVQVFANLVENACKYAADGRRVVLRIAKAERSDGAYLDAGVEDFGPGIPPEHVPRLTERFYRVETGSSRAKRGTGLGLSIVRNIATRHRARLSIASRPGAGSTFTVRFPVVSD